MLFEFYCYFLAIIVKPQCNEKLLAFVTSQAVILLLNAKRDLLVKMLHSL